MLTLDNRSQDPVLLALFARPTLNPGMGAIAWRVIDLAAGQTMTVALPRVPTLTVFYGGDRQHPAMLNRATEPVVVTQAGTNFVIEDDPARDDVSLRVCAMAEHGEHEWIGVINRHDRGVSLQLRLDGAPVVAPMVLWPGAAFHEAPWPRLYALVVASSTQPGDPIGTQADAGFPCEITACTRRLTITGARWEGYSITATDDDV